MALGLTIYQEHLRTGHAGATSCHRGAGRDSGSTLALGRMSGSGQPAKSDGPATHDQPTRRRRTYGDSPELPPCPECSEAFRHERGTLLVCLYGHGVDADDAAASDEAGVIKDAVGNVLAGDTVTVVKTVKVKGGGSGVIKAGTKVRASA